MQLLHFLQPFFCLCYATANSVFIGLEPHNQHPRILNTQDSRTDGISYEINREVVAEHLKATTVGQLGSPLDDLMKPGRQHISLTYWTAWSCSRTDYFLHVLKDARIAKDSRWTIDARGTWGYQGNVTLLAEVIRTLPAIDELHWDTMWLIPAVVLRALEESHPECRLYYTIAFNGFDNDESSQRFPFNTVSSIGEQNILQIEEYQQVLDQTSSQSILGSKNLYSFQARIDHNLLYATEKLDLVHQILLSCPSIRELDLRIDIDRCGDVDSSKCCENPSENAVLAFNFTRYEGMFPPLEVLRLEGYRFDFAVDGTHVPADMPYDIRNLKEWQKHMDWSHLHSLHLSNPLARELILFREILPNLRRFGVDGGDLNHVRPRLEKYLAGLSPLESLTLQQVELRPLDNLLDIIQNNHTTLRSVKLNHERDGPRRSTNRDTFWINHFGYAKETFLSNAQLDRLFEVCPDLQSLDLDVPRASEWNYDLFDKLLSFPQLKELTLRFPPEKSSQLYDGFVHVAAEHEQPELRIAMKGLRNYLQERKVGEPFVVLKTFLGCIEFKDGDLERVPWYNMG